MAIHVSATTGCNLGCTYCYENPDRERKQEWVDRQYDIEKIMSRLHEWKEKYPNITPGMHGGEPLLVRKEHLDRVWGFVYEHYNETSHIQTNGTLMDEDHVELFKKYDVSVGISCDGPADLNTERRAAGERSEDADEVTNNMTQSTHDAIDMLIEEGVSLGIIIVLHETNAGTDEDLEKLFDWVDYLCKNGVGGHFNPAIPYEDVQNDISLSTERLKEVYLQFWDWMKEEDYRVWGPHSDYVDNILGLQLSNCVNQKCDVFNAGAAKIVMGDGETTGCGKTWSQVGDGVPFLQGDSTDNEYDDDEERYEMLKQTPGPYTDGDAPDMGGCKGCEYWNICQGGCPGAGMYDDYRNRTVFCKAVYALYEQIERDLRGMMPNVRTITELPWDAEIADKSARWELDIGPFEAMDPGRPGKSSTQGGVHLEDIENRVPDDVMPEMSWEEQKARYSQQYPEEHVVFNEEERTIHADSSITDGFHDADEAKMWNKVNTEDDDTEE
jgi:uncharacterized protein